VITPDYTTWRFSDNAVFIPLLYARGWSRNPRALRGPLSEQRDHQGLTLQLIEN